MLEESKEGSRQDLCPVREYINVLQEKWVMHIVRALLGGTKGFNELGREIGGANPTTLSQRLERLESLGIVERRVCSTMPPRTEYSLTQAGVELDDVISAIDRWSRRHADSLPADPVNDGSG